MLVVEFGSKKRGDYERSSDRDILLIGDNWPELTTEKVFKKNQGYSVTCLTTDKAAYLIGSGSLFLKHVIDEGNLISGVTSDYNNLIAEWSSARSYEGEIQSNLDLLEVLNFVPKSSAGLLIVIDIIISSVRNIAIRKLANEGRYIFSWAGILLAAAQRDEIKVEDVPLFLEARSIKNQYRSGFLPSITEKYVNGLGQAAAKILGSKKLYRFGHHRSIAELPTRYQDGTYKQLRAVELLCGEYNFDRSLRPFMTWVKDPSYFCARGPGRFVSNCRLS
jgi:hypothetical protein